MSRYLFTVEYLYLFTESDERLKMQFVNCYSIHIE